jgi:hypothetical protein
MSIWNSNTNNNINHYIQFCLNYQTQVNNMILTQNQMSNNLFNLISNRTNNTRTDTTRTNTTRTDTTRTDTTRTDTTRTDTTRTDISNADTNRSNTSRTNTTRTNIPFERTRARIFTFPLTNNINGITRTINNGFTEMLNELFNEINTENVSLNIPSQEQINNSCEIVKYQEISSVHDCCPISLIPFQQDDNVMRIKYCNHIFLPENLRRWFSQSSKCPLCRFDIRYYTNSNDTSNNDTSNNDTSNNDTSNNDTSNNDTSNNDTSNNDTSNNDTSNNDTSNNDISNNIITPTFTHENTHTTPTTVSTNIIRPNNENNSTYFTSLQLLNGFNDIFRRQT